MSRSSTLLFIVLSAALAGCGNLEELHTVEEEHRKPKPFDLVVTAVTMEPEVITPGAPVTFSARITNAGASPTPGGIGHGVHFFLDGAPGPVTWSDGDPRPLAPGE